MSSFSDAGTQAEQALISDYYDGAGRWRMCDAPSCKVANSDWGADAATDALYLRWSATNDPRAKDILGSLIRTSDVYPDPCDGRGCARWSDTAAWDTVAFMRMYEATDDPQALLRAERAYAFVDRSKAYLAGACPAVPYQQPLASASTVKTLETLANEIKGSLLLYRATGVPGYLQDARSRYADARTFFLDKPTMLYTVHVRDDGTLCTPVRGRYFASVNGLMIWNGTELNRVTGDATYGEDAVATAQAVEQDLSDSNGIFTDAGGDNDVVEPLVEGMFVLAESGDTQAFDWIRRNAGAALGARGPDGSFARFFNGPPQEAPSIWESNGGFAVEIAAAALDPAGATPPDRPWTGATVNAGAVRTLPATFTVDGSAFALSGTLNQACMQHHLLVTIDGVPIVNRAGLWQNPSMTEQTPIVFAWQWAQPGVHTVTIYGNSVQADDISLNTYILH